MRTLFRLLAWLISIPLLVLVVLLAYLFFFEVQLPRCVIDQVEKAISSHDTLIRIGDVSLCFPTTLRFSRLRVFTREKPGTEPFLSAQETLVRFAWQRLSLSLTDGIESVTIHELKMPRVNEGYYIPDSIEFPGSSDYTEKNEPLRCQLPNLRPFRLTLIHPDVLGVRATKVIAGTVSSRHDCLRVDDIALTWPDTDVKMTLAGECIFDIGRQMVKGQVHGQARQHNIRPLLVALDITNSLQFVDAFTGVEPPVDATCRWDVNLVNNDLHLALDLHPSGGAYRKVPLKDVHGTVDVRVFVRDHYQNACITVGLLSGTLADGAVLRGSVIYKNTNDVRSVCFNAFSTAKPQEVLTIANTLNDGTLDCLQIAEDNEMSLRGVLSVLPSHLEMNDLRGTLAFRKGSLFGIPLADASMIYKLKQSTVTFTDARARLPAGGTVTGDGFINMPKMSAVGAMYGVNLVGERIPLATLAEIFKKDADGRSGLVNCKLAMHGPIGTVADAKIASTGSISIVEGNLRQFSFFNGLLGLIAKVPGLEKINDFVDDNDDTAAADFCLNDGVLTLKNVSITGGTLAIAGEGTYSSTNDELDFRLRVRIVRPDTIQGKLLSWLTEPVSKMLLQIQLTGSLKHPKWAWDLNMRSIFPPL